MKEDPVTKNVTVRYSTPNEGVKDEEFDMVVLSIGLNPPTEALELAKKFGVELNEHDFAKLDPSNPMETNRPGIFVSGAFQGPIDIPESVFSASGAGAQIGELLDYRRGQLTRERVYPEERDVSGEEPRIGVFVCHCGANIGRDRKYPGHGRILQDPAERRPRAEPALLVRDELRKGDNGRHEGERAEPRCGRRLLPEDA